MKKKSDANELGMKIAEASSSLLAQTVGHSILLYRPSEPHGRVTQMLNAALMQNEKVSGNGDDIKAFARSMRGTKTTPVNNSPPSVILSDDGDEWASAIVEMVKIINAPVERLEVYAFRL